MGTRIRMHYYAHIQAKDQAPAKKTRDKEAASDKIIVWTMDLQAVLLCPKTKASTMYYKTKLQVHNFTCINLGNKDVTASLRMSQKVR